MSTPSLDALAAARRAGLDHRSQQEAKIAELQEALRQAQLIISGQARQISTLQEEKTQLTFRVEGLLEQLRVAKDEKISSNQKIGNVDADIMRADADIRLFAQVCTIFHEFFPSEQLLKRARPSNIDPASEARFHNHEQDQTMYNLGSVVLFHDLLPETLRGLYEAHTAQFVRAFHCYAKEIRTTITNNLKMTRQHIYRDVPGLSVDVFSDPKNPERVRQCETLRQLLVGVLPDYPAILYLSGDSTKTAEVFLSDVLVKIATIVLHGKTALQVSRNKWAGRYYQEWKQSSPTPSFIAMCAVMATYLISGDPTFSSPGTETGIEYRTRLRSYNALLTLGWDTAPIKRVRAAFDYVFFNGRIFTSNGEGEVLRMTGIDGSTQRAAVLHAMRAETVPEQSASMASATAAFSSISLGPTVSSISAPHQPTARLSAITLSAPIDSPSIPDRPTIDLVDNGSVVASGASEAGDVPGTDHDKISEMVSTRAKASSSRGNGRGRGGKQLVQSHP
ncbi:hypothetical protein K525DRAFT_266976 [Schizophyllum commune Loenen D]|nr:hypothetical protein K525DRAFT_266976 [Schizophyllum commune Loenen D]